MSAAPTESKPALTVSRRPRRLIAGAVVIAAILGIAVLADDYGQSWDDHGNAKFGADSLRAYAGSDAFLAVAADRLHHGPFFFMVSHVAVSAAGLLAPNLLAVDIRHALNASLFALTAICMYWLSIRLTRSPPASLLVVLLFGTQPVLFGHAFINQKDTPFAALFTLAVASGVAAAELAERKKPAHPHLASDGGADLQWGQVSTRRRWLTILLGLLALLLSIDLVARGLIHRGLLEALEMAYAGSAPQWLNAVFLEFASDAHKTALHEYEAKLNQVYRWVSVLTATLCVGFALALTSRVLPPVRRLVQGERGSRLLAFSLAGILLGWCTATRALGVYAGALVSLLAVQARRRDMAVDLAVYWALAAVTTFVFWPFLWAAPAQRFIESIGYLADFPQHIVLFEHVHYLSGGLPRAYLPSLLAIQLTETALLAIATGTVLAVRRLWRRHPTLDLLVVVLAWLVVPLAYVLVFRPSIYGNFRQFLFILPPLFLMAGLAIEWLFARLRRPVLQALAAALMLAPGLTAIIQLHPYEYIYYNSLIGGTQGAVGRFQLDYWCTSYRAAMEYINEHAAPGAVVAVNDPLHPARTFARSDLQVVRALSAKSPDFALTCDEQEFVDRFYPEMTTVQVITIDGATLAEVKRLPEATHGPAGSP